MNKTANQRLIEAKSERDVEQALLQAISTILPTQEKFERVFGRGQWQGYLKKLIGGQDILKGFMRESNAGDYAWIKIALGKAKTAQDLKTLIQKLERQIISAATRRLHLAGEAIEALTEEQFDKWDSKRKATYLKEHPNSKFGKGSKVSPKPPKSSGGSSKPTSVKLDAKGKKAVVRGIQDMLNSDDATPRDVQKYLGSITKLAGDEHSKELDAQLKSCLKLNSQVNELDRIRRSTDKGNYLSDFNSPEYKQALKRQKADSDFQDKEQELTQLVKSTQDTIGKALKKIGINPASHRRHLDYLIRQAISSED